MDAIVIVRTVFTVVGIGMLAGSVHLGQSTRAFLAEASKAEGTVVDLVQSRSSDSTTYRPVVRFTSRKGEPIEFIADVGSNPPSHAIAQAVEVFYLPSEPHKAKINGFFSLWGAAAVLGGMGSLFFSIGAGLSLAASLNRRKQDFLRTNGMPIQTEFQGVELNTGLSVNGVHPYRVLSQWQNPSTSEVHVFRSENIWFDPSNYIDRTRITVFIEANNPRQYLVDLSFLPGLAKAIRTGQ